MSARIKDKVIEAMITGIVLTVMAIFVTFIWNQALRVSSVMVNVETKIQEVVQTVNVSNNILSDRIDILELNSVDKDIKPISLPSYAPSPIIKSIMGEDIDIESIDVLEDYKQSPIQIEQYQKSWK